ncbi:MAG: hypothetical protein Kow001_13840 [Acidobacteriota bacterium]
MKRVCVLICVGLMLMMPLSAQGLGGSHLLSDSEMAVLQGAGDVDWCGFGSGVAWTLTALSTVAFFIPGGQPFSGGLRIAGVLAGAAVMFAC